MSFSRSKPSPASAASASLRVRGTITPQAERARSAVGRLALADKSSVFRQPTTVRLSFHGSEGACQGALVGQVSAPPAARTPAPAVCPLSRPSSFATSRFYDVPVAPDDA